VKEISAPGRYSAVVGSRSISFGLDLGYGALDVFSEFTASTGSRRDSRVVDPFAAQSDSAEQFLSQLMQKNYAWNGMNC
jgi:hypothetical protein